MNWLYIIIMAYIVVSALRGYRRGFIRVVYSMAAFLITIIFITFSMPMITKIIREQTPIADSITDASRKYLETAVQEKLTDGSLRKAQGRQIGFLSILSMVPDELWDEMTHAVQDTVGESKILDQMAKTVTDYLVSFLAFLIATAVIQILLFIIGKKLDLFAKTPGIHLANMILGFCAGIVKAFLVIWAFFAVIQILSPLPVCASVIKLIEDNKVLSSLYEQNRLLELLEKWI